MLSVGANDLKQAFFFSCQWKSQVNIWSLVELSADAKFSELRTRNPAWKALRGITFSVLANDNKQKPLQADSALHHAK